MYTQLIKQILDLGATGVAEIAVSKMQFEPSFRSLCEANSCGKYGKSWACPPMAGEAQDLIAKAKKYSHAIVYQTVSPLEDSYDIEGMEAACTRHHTLSSKVTELAKKQKLTDFLNLSAGGCSVCSTCAALEDKSCYFPEKRVSSLDAYCVNVSLLAKDCDLKYVNGQNTVTYFSALLIKE